MINPRTGKIERVFVNLEAVYPNPNDPSEEMSFEELRAKSRGWLDKDWVVERSKEQASSAPTLEQENVNSPATAVDDVGCDTQESQPCSDASQNIEGRIESKRSKDCSRESKSGRPKKMKVMEVKAETQTSKSFLICDICTLC